jgi:hypothetical protein
MMPDSSSMVMYLWNNCTTFAGNPSIIINQKALVVMRPDAAHHAFLKTNFHWNFILVDTIPAGLSLISSGKKWRFPSFKTGWLHGNQGTVINDLAAGPAIPGYKCVFSFAVKTRDMELLEKLNPGAFNH